MKKINDHLIVWGLLLVTFSICGLTTGGHVYVRDGAAMYMMSLQLLENGRIDVPLHQNTIGGKIGPDGRYYMPFGFLQPVLGMPFVYLGKILASKTQTEYITFFAATWLNWLMVALLSVLIYIFGRLWGLAAKSAIAAAFVFCFTSPFWVYSQTFFSEPMAGLFTLLSFYYLYRAKSSQNPIFLIILAGIFAGTIIWLRPLCGLTIPTFYMYLLLNEKSATSHSLKNGIKQLLAFTFPVISGIAGYLGYNFYRFGHILETGYDKLPDGSPRSFTLDPLYGAKVLLLSPGKSIFIFFPILLLLPFGIYFLVKTRRISEVLTISLSGILYLYVLSFWSRVEGGVTWGPRLFLPVVPLLFLLVLPLFQCKSRILKWSVNCLVITGFLVQCMGVCLNFSTIIYQHIDEYFSPADGIYVFEFNPFSKHHEALQTIISTPERFSKRAPEQAASHRSLNQINPLDGLDFWWLHFYRDNVPINFIVTTLIILGLLLLLGLLCLAPVFLQRK